MSGELVRSCLVMLQLLEQELLYFSAFWIVLGAVDEFAVDCMWIGTRLARWRRPEAGETVPGARQQRLAVFIAAWQESQVVGHMIGHALRVWPERELRLYVGCYGNDPATVAAAMAGGRGDPRLRVVIHDRPGPTTKADCLNRVYRAMCADETRERRRFTGVIMHDAEQVVSVVTFLRAQQSTAESSALIIGEYKAAA